MTASTPLDPDADFLGHPKGLYICFFTEMWERFSFYGMKALLLLYLLKYHRFSDEQGYDLLGAYGGLAYALPVIGGLVADRYLGMRRAVILGGCLLVLGHVGMAYEGQAARVVGGAVIRDAAALQIFYLSLALIVVGVGFLKPNISTLVGRLYGVDDPRRDSGFTWFYAGINVGALFSSLICAYLGETYGWRYGFGAAGIGMVAGLLLFVWGQRYLGGLAEPAEPALLHQRCGPLRRETLIYLGAFAGVLLVWQLIQRTWTVHGAMHLIALGFAIWFAWFLRRRCSPVERGQMLSLVALIVSVLLFFTLYEQTYGSWITFTDRLMSKRLSALESPAAGLPWAFYALALSPLLMVMSLRAADRGQHRLALTGVLMLLLSLVVAIARDILLVPQTAGSLTFLGAFFVILPAPLFSWLWPALARRGWRPGKPLKMSLGLIAAGLAFVPMIAAADSAADGALASIVWLVLAYCVLEIGELCLSPIGLSAVTELSVPRVVGVMMGAFWLATAYSEVLAAQFGKLASSPPIDGVAIDAARLAANYRELFEWMAVIGVGSGLLLLLLSRPLDRLMAGGARTD